MGFEKAFVPYGCYWSTPFSKWQGSFAHLHAMKFAADVAVNELGKREISPEVFDNLILGMTIPQKSCFYGAPWMAGMVGAVGIAGTVVSQACSTSAKMLGISALEIDSGTSECIFNIACDKTSNGPHIYYPNPMGPGGTGDKEDWVWDNFGYDPFAKNAMIETAEKVAKEAGITREEQDDVALMRYEQYQDALKDDKAFHKRYMTIPCEVKNRSGRKVIKTLEGDEGIFPTTKEGLAKLKPVMKEGTVTFGTQTFPADGNAAMVVTTKDRAKELSKDKNIEIQIVSYGQGRAKKGFMAQALIPAAKQALERAGISIGDCKAVKTHNPFCVNDVYFSKEMGIDLKDFNNYGSPLIWGHPQAPTALRAEIELIEELALAGGGYGLFNGCAAGDTAGAVVFKVDVS